jgi:hypothetical protein
MKTVSHIYEDYNIMPHLQMHMLRVAAVAFLICENMETEVDKENIVLAELFHDMGNLIKVDFDVFPEFFKEKGLDFWKGIKEKMIQKYGPDEHHGNLTIMGEIGLPARAIELADSNRFSQLCSHKERNDLNISITHYSDGRVAPYGVVSYQARMDEAGERYKDRLDIFKLENRTKLVKCGLEIEKQIFENCRIKPEDITDEAVAPIIEQLKNLVIKS